MFPYFSSYFSHSLALTLQRVLSFSHVCRFSQFSHDRAPHFLLLILRSAQMSAKNITGPNETTENFRGSLNLSEPLLCSLPFPRHCIRVPLFISMLRNLTLVSPKSQALHRPSFGLQSCIGFILCSKRVYDLIVKR